MRSQLHATEHTYRLSRMFFDSILRATFHNLNSNSTIFTRNVAIKLMQKLLHCIVSRTMPNVRPLGKLLIRDNYQNDMQSSSMRYHWKKFRSDYNLYSR